MGFLKNLFCKKNKYKAKQSKVSVNQSKVSIDYEMNYYICLEKEVYGPFTLQELKQNYTPLKDTLITTDTLKGEWYEAKCFECFDELFNHNQDFYINEFGEIVKKNKKNKKYLYKAKPNDIKTNF